MTSNALLVQRQKRILKAANKDMMIKKELFGVTDEGEDIFSFTFGNKQGTEIVILNYGGIVQSIRVPDAAGETRDVCLGFDTITQYEEDTTYMGAMIGRCANRIGGGSFSINGTTYKVALNNGPNHLHGGNKGFNKFVYDCSIDGDKLILTRRSIDMEEGYPGNLDLSFGYSLSELNELVLEYNAVSDADTIVNLTNHCYFNLAGEGKGDIHNHSLTIRASFFSENDENCLPTGRLLPVEDTPFDFREPKTIGEDIGKSDIQLLNCNGYDHNYILDAYDNWKPSVELFSKESGITLSMTTTKPCMQLYTGNFLSGAKGKSANYTKRAGLCLEAQYRPNMQDSSFAFKPPYLKSGEQYRHKTVYRFGVG